MKGELKPCPFCGSSKVSVSYVHHKIDEEDYFYYRAGCDSCFIGYEEHERESAVSQWNLRVVPRAESTDRISLYETKE